MSVCILIALWYHFGYGTLPFLVIFAGGYFYVGFASLHALWKMNQEVEIPIDEAPLAPAAVIAND